MNIIKAIIERRSVRSFNGECLTPDQTDILQKAIDDSSSPFGGNVSIRLRHFGSKGEYRPSTYGVIRGACDYFLIAMGPDDHSALSAGFRFEQVVLKAWRLGLGTCWIAATFKGSDFDRAEIWPSGESLKIISPVGVASKQSLIEKVTRMTLGSKRRKPFDQLFFSDDFTHPLDRNNTFARSLDMLRLAPSSTNSQPWRAVVTNDKVRFYYIPKSKLSILDCGIGLCHFHECEKHLGHNGIFVDEAAVDNAPSRWKYLITYRREVYLDSTRP